MRSKFLQMRTIFLSFLVALAGFAAAEEATPAAGDAPGFEAADFAGEIRTTWKRSSLNPQFYPWLLEHRREERP